MRTALLFVLVAILGGCPDKKKAPPPPPAAAGEGSTAPVLQPVENKLDKAMNTNEQRAKPEAESP